MKLVRLILCVTGVAVVAAALGGACWVHSLPPAPTLAELDVSTQVLDRNGRLLRAYATPDGRWRLPTTVDDVDPRFVEMLLAYEDRRFPQHARGHLLAVAPAPRPRAGQGRRISRGPALTPEGGGAMGAGAPPS